MQFVIVNNEREEAKPNLTGTCPGCGGPMVAKCGDIKVWHWAHLGKRSCDTWWEPETEWHRNWKSHFPMHWREIFHRSKTGEHHCADVKTPDDWVIEFQHSNISRDERKSRNVFYPKLVWVVDGLRRKRDHKQFKQSLRVLAAVNNPIMRHICEVREIGGALFRDWGDNTTPVFFDFGEAAALWCMLPRFSEKTFVVEVHRQSFIDYIRNGTERPDIFSEFVASIVSVVNEVAVLVNGRAQQLEARAKAAGNHFPNLSKFNRRF